MRVAALELSHFRSWRRARIEADGGPIAVHGPNGAGKTNLLEAISLLSPGRGLRRAEPEGFSRRPESLGWRVAALVEGGGDAHEVETSGEAGAAARAVRIDGKAAPQTRLGAVLRMLWLTPAMDRLWIEGASGRRRFLDRMALGFEPGHAEAALAYEKAMRERNRLLRDEVRDPRWFAALEARMAEAGAVLTAARRALVARLAEAQTGAETAFPAAELALAPGYAAEAEAGADAAALAEALAAGRTRDQAAGRTLEGPHRADLDAIWAAKGMPARDCSTGEQKALLVSLVLAAARALRAETGEAPVLLLDEVAAHLDEGRRAALYDELVALGAQAWMTGTDPTLFAALGGRARRLAVRETDGGSTLV
ncbi:MAG: DNA replication/repair protein RecF [Paracoccaceae bacterium]